MNNKPVAWMHADTGHLCSGGFLMTKMQDYIPLYIHPVKELTDAELFKIYADLQEGYSGNDFPVDHAFDLGRAILRKAQEQ